MKYDISTYNQELSTLEGVIDYIQKRIDIVNGFDKYNQELSNLEHIKEYVQMKIDIVMGRYCRIKDTI